VEPLEVNSRGERGESSFSPGKKPGSHTKPQRSQN